MQYSSPGVPVVDSSGLHLDGLRRWPRGPPRTLVGPRCHLRPRVEALAWRVTELLGRAFLCGAGISVQ